MLDAAFEALKTYNWGTERKVLAPIDDAVVKSHGDAAARKDLETRLAAVLKTDASRDAKDYVCRKLMIVGTAASVPTLADLLADKDLSHMARYALERIQGPEAAKALRDSLSKATGAQKAGVIGSIGARGDTDAVEALAPLVKDADLVVAKAAITALGNVGTAAAAKALDAAKPTDPAVVVAAVDANLVCAEKLLAAGNKGEALAIYKKYIGEGQPKHVRMAGTRGMVACSK